MLHLAGRASTVLLHYAAATRLIMLTCRMLFRLLLYSYAMD